MLMYSILDVEALRPGNMIRLVTVDGRVLNGVVTGSGPQCWVDFTDKNGDPWVTRASELVHCRGTLEVIENG